ncbi:(-)-alpha-terpineol synthase [Handroanthus impetiginosus]|uniref:(-)-alpha-terpineol synthase n=1 Tax=Handroanthus impetiginosus TaxID=429701 RepID=A0A2G9HM99_9LAMI|nr:(-)-alpha-terpineol synthase [Handroanthus impetiginosus]
MATRIMHVPMPRKTSNYLHTKAFEKGYVYSKTTSINVKPCSVLCTAEKPTDRNPIERRRSGNYKPPSWDFDYIQSLNSEYKGEKYLRRVFELKKRVKMMLEGVMDRVDQLEFIDDLQKLGILYHFEDKIKRILENIYHDHISSKTDKMKETNLYSTALEYILLRQHGFCVSQEIFDSFKKRKGDFKESLVDDTKGLLQLYEASFLMAKGEYALELAREFATIFLQKKLDEGNNAIDDYLALLVRNALDLPLHWRVERPKARWFIEVYEKRPSMNAVVLELAKLDFNIVQAIHQEELKHISRWWKRTSITEKLPFARDRIVESYIWSVAGHFEPQYAHFRTMGTKVNAFITVLDDIFDVYGTLEELQLFNYVIQRWDIKSMEQLPHYMQVMFLALNNLINEIAYDVLKDQGIVIIPYLRKLWADLSQSYFQEAKWQYEKYKPTLQEYVENGWISISAPVILCHAFLLLANPIEIEVVQSLFKYHNVVRLAGIILRLVNDLGTSPDEMKRGDVLKSVQCYMNETGACEEEAREYIRFLIGEAWKEMNRERVAESSFPHEFIRSAVNLGRTAQYMYHHGDGHGHQQHPEIKDQFRKLLFEPIA